MDDDFLLLYFCLALEAADERILRPVIGTHDRIYSQLRDKILKKTYVYSILTTNTGNDKKFDILRTFRKERKAKEYLVSSFLRSIMPKMSFYGRLYCDKCNKELGLINVNFQCRWCDFDVCCDCAANEEITCSCGSDESPHIYKKKDYESTIKDIMSLGEYTDGTDTTWIEFSRVE